jgi:hypothetical protein
MQIILFLEGISRRHQTRKAHALRVFLHLHQNIGDLDHINEKAADARKAPAAFLLPAKGRRIQSLSEKSIPRQQ